MLCYLQNKKKKFKLILKSSLKTKIINNVSQAETKKAKISGQFYKFHFFHSFFILKVSEISVLFI